MTGALRSTILRCWWIPVCAVLLGAFGGWWVSGPPTSTAEIVVIGRVTNDRDSALTMNQYLQARMPGYVVVATGDVVRMAAEAGGGMPADALKDRITVENPPKTTTLIVHVQAELPEQAQYRARAVVDEIIRSIDGLENGPGNERIVVEEISPPDLPAGSTSPAGMPAPALGAITGLAFGSLALVGVYARQATRRRHVRVAGTAAAASGDLPSDDGPAGEGPTGGRSGAIGRSVVIQIAARTVGMVASFATVTISARYLGLERYGLLTTAVVFVGLFASFTELGIGQVVIRRAARGHGRLAELVGTNLAFSLVFAPVVAVVTACAGFLVYHDDPTLQLAVAIVAGGLMLTALSTPWNPIYEVHLRFGAVAFADVTSRILTLAATAVVAATDSGLLAMAAVQVIPMVVTLAVTWLTAPRIQSVMPVLDRRKIVSLLRESMPFTLLLVVAVLYYRADGLLLSLLAEPEDVGIYGIAVALLGMISFVSTIVCKAVYPTMAETFTRNKERFRRNVEQSFGVMLAIAAPVAFLGWVYAEQMLGVLGTAEFVTRGTSALQLFLIAGALSFLNGLLTQPLIAAGEQRFLTWAVPLGLVVNIALNLALVPRFGVVGTSIALIVSEAQGSALALWRLRRLGHSPLRLRVIVLLVPGLALALGAAWLLAGVPFVVSALVAAGVYAVSTVATGAVPLGVLKQMSKKSTPEPSGVAG